MENNPGAWQGKKTLGLKKRDRLIVINHKGLGTIEYGSASCFDPGPYCLSRGSPERVSERKKISLVEVTWCNAEEGQFWANFQFQ